MVDVIDTGYTDVLILIYTSYNDTILTLDS